jgi:hypothetical protein
MSDDTPILSIAEVSGQLGQTLIQAQATGDIRVMHIVRSIASYLVDAERWHYVRDNQGGIPELDSPQAVTEYVDKARGAK